MAYAYYPKLWQKAFLIEILRKDSGALVKSFAFSLPPEAVRVESPAGERHQNLWRRVRR